MDEIEVRLMRLEAQMMGVITTLNELLPLVAGIAAVATGDEPHDLLKTVLEQCVELETNMARLMESLPPPPSGNGGR